MIHTVYLDMDEVLVDFNKAVCELMGILYDYENFSQNYDWFPSAGWTREQVDAVCTVDFWANLEWMHDGHEILRAIVGEFYPKQIYLLTHCMPNVDSPSGKMLWLEKHLPEYRSQTILLQFGVSKSQLAKSGTLLIDDKDEAVEGFIAEGGQGILVPRPWNRLRAQADRSSQYVRECLETLC